MATAGGGPNQFDEDLEHCVNVSLAKYFPDIDTPTKQQMEAWRGLFRGNDVFAILPTGAGKSLIYQLIPSITQELGKMPGHGKWKGKKFVVVVSPLLAIIETQTIELNKRGMTALNLTKEMDEGAELQLKNGDFDILFGSPESFVGTDKWTAIFKSDTFRSKSIALIADEAHCIPKWLVRTQFLSLERKCLETLFKCCKTWGHLNWIQQHEHSHVKYLKEIAQMVIASSFSYIFIILEI